LPAFGNDRSAQEYDRGAAEDSFERVKAFLDRYLGRPGG
jgi:dienelactone hydrolase